MRLGMRELPRRGADLLRGAMRIAKVSRNRFEDDEADEADFSAFARLHSDSRFGHKLTRQARLNTVAGSSSPATSFIVILLVLPLCLPLSVWLVWQPASLENAGGGAAQAKTRPYRLC